MKVVVFGATGKVGRLVVQKLLDAGHSVTAFVYGDSPFTKDTKLTVVEGNVYSQWDVEQAVSGHDVVVSTLGSWGTKRKDVLTKGMENIINAMHDGGVERVVSLTGADARLPNEKAKPISTLMHALIILSPARKILKDGETHMKLLCESGLKWTVLRSPIMNTNGSPKDYEVSGRKPMPWETIHRSSVAQAIVDLIEDTKYHNNAPYIRRAK